MGSTLNYIKRNIAILVMSVALGGAAGLITDIPRSLVYEFHNASSLKEALDNHVMETPHNPYPYAGMGTGAALGLLAAPYVRRNKLN